MLIPETVSWWRIEIWVVSRERDVLCKIQCSSDIDKTSAPCLNDKQWNIDIAIRRFATDAEIKIYLASGCLCLLTVNIDSVSFEEGKSTTLSSMGTQVLYLCYPWCGVIWIQNDTRAKWITSLSLLQQSQAKVEVTLTSHNAYCHLRIGMDSLEFKYAQ